jgi:acyl dehydratase/NAD(P)-dependent dehydrogenase (short-subunit alcohol dehydrogenase family)
VKSASFRVEVSQADADAFAKLSGDWNPLHTDAEHARRTIYGRRVLHGAFSASLISRLAGMQLPGPDCLLHSMHLRFIAPIPLPASLLVSGRVTAESSGTGRVEATVSDTVAGTAYVDAAYEFSLHRLVEAPDDDPALPARALGDAQAPIVVTGATGGLGRALLRSLGDAALGVSRTPQPGMLGAPDLEQLQDALRGRRIQGIVHCAWPAPDNERLVDLAHVGRAVDYNLAAPVGQIITLAQLLAEHGTKDAMLVLVGSTAANPGRHNYRMPLYSLAKTLIPELTRILALELASAGMRCAAVVYDVIEGGMNKHLSPSARLAHVDRSPSGRLASTEEAALQIVWLLENRSFLVSGATITLTGGALP